MPFLQLCPNAQVLERHLLGLTSDPEASRLDEHLSSCEHCSFLAGSVSGADEFTETVRTAADRLRRLPQDEAIQQLIAKNQGLGRFVGRTEETITASRLPGTVRPTDPDATEECFEFLRPPEATGEIGWIGPYRVLKLIGKGGMGMVFEAEDPHLGRTVALKVMKPSLAEGAKTRARFLREARAVAALADDHVVPIFQAGEDRGVPYLAMPRLEGESIDARLRREGALPVGEALRIAREAALGLAAAHAKGLIHRDIKPANIWLEASSGRVRLLDFGLVRAADGDPSLTLPEAVAGTPQYMSPEQARGKMVTPRSDLFSVGCVLYHMLTGRLPFHGDDALSTLAQLTSSQPEPPAKVDPRVPLNVSDLVLRFLAKSPDDRPASARAAADALAAVASEAGAPPARQRRRLFLAACAVPFLMAAAYVLTLRTSEGTIDLTVNEPDVQVRVDGKPQGFAITSPRESVTIRVAPGGHMLEVKKEGFTTYTKEFRVERGGREALSARLVPVSKAEGPPVAAISPVADAAPTPDWPEPFVLVRDGKPLAEHYKHFTAALAARQAGDIIEVHGNGPFRVPSVRLEGGDAKPLSMRAASGFRPRFITAAQTSPDPAWFHCSGAPLRLEGCDFFSTRPTAFAGIGASMEFVKCRIIAQNGYAVSHHDRGQVRIVDCLVANEGASGAGLMAFNTGTDAHLENNVLRDGWGGFMIGLGSNGTIPLRLHLRRNTIVHSGDFLSFNKDPGPEKIVVNADENLFQVHMLAWSGKGLTADLKDELEWHGRDNLYSGKLINEPPYGGTDFETNPERRPRKGIAGWEALWGPDESGAQSVPESIFAWAEIYRLEPQNALAALRRITEQARAAQRLDQVGPDWDIVGPGDAYLRALAASGRPVPKEHIRPEPEEAGPLALVRNGRTVGSHPTLNQALGTATDGDVIEIRSDGEFPDVTFWSLPEGTRTLTLRAAPGYRPTLCGRIDVQLGNAVAFEGMTFRDAHLACAGPEKGRVGRVFRLANCAASGRFRATGESGHSLLHDGCPTGEAPLEIINCLLYGRNGTVGQIEFRELHGSAVIRNSVLSRLYIHSLDGGAPRLSLDHCVYWNPDTGADVTSSWIEDRPQGREAALSAQDTLFELTGPLFGLWLPAADTKTGSVRWKGDRNVYRNALAPFASSLGAGVLWQDIPLIGGERNGWQSEDTGSVVADPVIHDPSQWRLLPDSPGYHSGPGGRDPGADVQRIATTGPRSPARSDAATLAAEIKTTAQAGGPDPTSNNQLDPFVLVRDGKPVARFPHLVAALSISVKGDTIEVHGNGPFRVPRIEISAGDNKSFNVRAAPGYRPRFVTAEPESNNARWVHSQEVISPFWIKVQGAPLKIEGCDVVGIRTYMLVGGGAPWEIVNCRIMNEYGPALSFDGGTLRVADCFISNEGRANLLAFGGGAEVMLENNVIRDAWEGGLLHLSSNDGVTRIRLRHNTIVHGSTVFAVVRGPGAPPVMVEAENNLFQTGQLVGTNEVWANLRADLDWHGRDNLYTGRMCNDPLIVGRDYEKIPEGRPANGVGGWKAYWGDAEVNPRESAEPHFQWAEVYFAPPDAALRLIRERTTRIREETHLTQLGPDWELVGPGPAYLRALAAVGRPVSQDQLRPAPEEGGSFVVIHEGRSDHGHFSMGQAIEAAVDGDVIEIRSDLDFPNITVPPHAAPARSLTIRAGAGYQPTLSARFHVGEGNVVSFEGLAFRDAHVETFLSHTDGPPGRLARLMNCSATSRFLPTYQADLAFLLLVGPLPPGPPLEIVNCLFYSRLGGAGQIHLGSLNGQVAIRNSVIGKIFVAGTEKERPAISLARCVVWNPDSGVLAASIAVPANLVEAVALNVQDTLFELGGQVVRSSAPDHDLSATAARWEGARNVYRNGALPLLAVFRADGWHCTSVLDTWRQFWKTSDVGSVATDSPMYEPMQWRLLPDSPGYRACKDGTDSGADVTRVAHTVTSGATGSHDRSPSDKGNNTR